MAPVMKQIPAPEGACLRSREEYIRDAANAAPGQLTGDKVAFYGTMGDAIEPGWRGTVQAMHCLEASYAGKSEDMSVHVVMSLREGERFTPETAAEAMKITAKHMGYEGHLGVWGVHRDTENSHLHMCFSRIAPEPGPDGQYRLALTGGSVVNPKSGHTYSHLSAAQAEAEIRHLQGWSREEKAVYDYKDGQYVRAIYPKEPAKRRLGSRVADFEAHHPGQKHPKTLLADRAEAVIMASGKDRAEAIRRLTAAGITVTETPKGGLNLSNEAVPKGIKASALAGECRWISKQEKGAARPEKIVKIELDTTTYEGAKKYAKQAIRTSEGGTELFQKLTDRGLAFEQIGKAGGRIRFAEGPTGTLKLSDCGTSFLKLQQKFGHFPPYALTIIDSQEKVNAQSPIMHGTEVKHASSIHENIKPAPLTEVARDVLSAGGTQAQTVEALAGQAVAMTWETSTDKKTGNEFTFVKFAREGEKPITLRDLGPGPDGKPLFSLRSLDQQWLKADALPVLAAHAAQGRTATAAALMGAGIVLSEVTRIVKDDQGAEKEIKFGQLERNGVTVALSALGKDDAGKAIYSLYGLEKAERENRQEALRAEAAPIIKAHKGYDDAAAALTAMNIRMSEEPAVIKDKTTGEMKEVIVTRIEKDGISVTLGSVGGKAREMQRTQLAQDAAKIWDAHSSYSAAEDSLKAAGINSQRVRSTTIDDDGQEKIITVIRLERDRITTSTGHAGKAYGVAALDNKFLPFENARSLYMEARQSSAPVALLASKGLTANDIDRVGRLGERLEAGIQRKEKPDAAPTVQAQAPNPQRSIIPKSITEILDLIAESAEQAAALAQANAQAARAQILANRADDRARRAEEALAELKASIKHETKPASAGKPAPTEPREAAMAEGNGGAVLAPEKVKQAPAEVEAKAPEETTTPPAQAPAPTPEEADQAKLQELLPESDPLTAEEIDLYAPVPTDDWQDDDQPYDDDDPYGPRM